LTFFKNKFFIILFIALSGCATITPPEFKFDVPKEQFSVIEIEGVNYEVGFIYTISERPSYSDCLKNKYIISQNSQKKWKIGGDLSNKYSERICIDHSRKLILVVYDAWLINNQNFVITNVGKEVITCSNIYGHNSGRGFHLIDGDKRPRSVIDQRGVGDIPIYHNCTSFFFKEANFSKTGNILSNIGSLGLNYALGSNPTYLVFSPEKVVQSALLTNFKKSREKYLNNIVVRTKRSLKKLNYYKGRSNGSITKAFINAIEEFLADEGMDIDCSEDCSNILQSDYFLKIIEDALKRIV